MLIKEYAELESRRNEKGCTRKLLPYFEKALEIDLEKGDSDHAGTERDLCEDQQL